MLETWPALPPLARAGLVVLGIGTLLDVALHALGAAVTSEHLAHGVVLGGMVLVLGGVVADGIGQARRQHRSNA